MRLGIQGLPRLGSGPAIQIRLSEMDLRSLPDTTHLVSGMAYLSLTLLGLAVGLPFLYPIHVLPIPSFYSEWLAIALGLGACLVFLGLRFWKNLSTPPRRPASFVAGGMDRSSGAVRGTHIHDSGAAARTLFGLGGISDRRGWVAATTTGTGKSFVCARLVSVRRGACCRHWRGFSQYLDLDGLMHGWVSLRQSTSIHGNIAQTNHFAAHIMIAALALIYLQAQHRIPLSLALPLLALFAIVLTLSSSRSVWLYVSGVLAFSLVTYGKTRDPVHRRLATFTGLLLALFLAAQLFHAASERVAQPRWPDRHAKSLSGSVLPRLVEWHKAWLIFLQSPIVGIGVGHYGWHSFNLHALPEFIGVPSEVISHHAHNLFLEVLAEPGLSD